MLQVDEARVCLAKAQTYWQAQQWEKTIQTCNQAIALDEKLPTAYKLLGDAFQRLGKIEAAIDNYRQAIAFDPNYAEAFANLGTLYAQQQEYEKATALYQQALIINPEFTQVSKHLVRVWELQQQGKNASVDLDVVTQPETVNCSTSLIKQAEELQQQGKLEAALQQYLDALEIAPQKIEIYQEVIKICEQLELWQEAAKYCRLVVQSDFKETPVIQQPVVITQTSVTVAKEHFDLGNQYSQDQKWQDAIGCYQKAIESDPQYGSAYHQLAEAYTHQQQWLEAVAAYRQAIKFKPDFSWSYNNLGYALIQLEQWSEAIPVYQQAIQLKPDFPWSYYNLAEAYRNLEQWKEAIAFYQQAAQIQADLPQVQQKLGDAYYQQTQQYRELALKHFQLAIEQDPQDPQPYHQALAIDKYNVELYLKLGDLLIQRGEIEEAIIIYQMALQIQPNNHQLMNRLQISLLKRDPEITQVLQYGRLLAQLEPQDNQEELQALATQLAQILPKCEQPTVSIIIPVYNQLNYTLQCLKAIALNLAETTRVEIIVVDDCSGDQTSETLNTINQINLIRHQSNQGFIHSCNHGASVAKGEYLYFLNNDTEIKPNCIESLIEVLVQDQEVGAVGSKLLYPQGSLQEAGGIIWQDASGWNYGRNDNAYAPEYNYLRPVDYCSGASLMVRKEIFEQLKGFEEDFAPAYYEDTDLCFAIRHQLGLKVMYQPKSQVIHYEGISSGTSLTTGAKQYQVTNAVKFKQKWQTVLESDGYLPNVGISNVPLSARKYTGQLTVLVIDSYPLYYDRESGSRRLWEILKIFKALNYHVIFLPDNGLKAEPYTTILQNLGIEVLYTQSGYGENIDKQLNERLSLIDVAWICRPQLNEKYIPLIRINPAIKVIYDTIDLHYLRFKRAWELSNNKDPKTATVWIDMQAKELKVAQQADFTITVTEVEQKILQAQGINNVAVIPNIHIPYQGEIPSFNERQGILFIGSYDHPPNVDAVFWLCQEIMPLVWQKNPNIKVTLLGNNPTTEVKGLESDRIIIPGYIHDLTPYFNSHKLSVSPLRYGAGMKGKIGQSLEYSLPVVSTSIGTEGMNLIVGEHILEANNAEDFARAILSLTEDKNLWEQISANCQSAIAIYTPQAIQLNIRELIEQLTK
ncbi:family 2 glycosyl transferase [Chondrocystis sp. NIES-4102]|nr:family 2 glycosyl transferase [Chondrocystis sp. NIES-4102]